VLRSHDLATHSGVELAEKAVCAGFLDDDCAFVTFVQRAGVKRSVICRSGVRGTVEIDEHDLVASLHFKRFRLECKARDFDLMGQMTTGLGCGRKDGQGSSRTQSGPQKLAAIVNSHGRYPHEVDVVFVRVTHRVPCLFPGIQIFSIFFETVQSGLRHKAFRLSGEDAVTPFAGNWNAPRFKEQRRCQGCHSVQYNVVHTAT